MAALSVQVPYPVFYDRDGQPLDNGNIYIGVANLDPVTNPLQVYYDEALTITASQPIKTSNGYIYRNGTPAQIYVNASNFSITVNDRKNLLVYNFPDGVGSSLNANDVEYNPPFTGAVTSDYTVSDKLSQSVSIRDFGVVGDGTDETTKIQTAVTYACNNDLVLIWNKPSSEYVFSSLTFPASKNVVWRGQGRKRINVKGLTTDAFIGSPTGSFVDIEGFRFQDFLSGFTMDGIATGAELRFHDLYLKNCGRIRNIAAVRTDFRAFITCGVSANKIESLNISNVVSDQGDFIVCYRGPFKSASATYINTTNMERCPIWLGWNAAGVGAYDREFVEVANCRIIDTVSTNSAEFEIHGIFVNAFCFDIHDNYINNVVDVSATTHDSEAIYVKGPVGRIEFNTVIDGGRGDGFITSKSFNYTGGPMDAPDSRYGKCVTIANNTVQKTAAYEALYGVLNSAYFCKAGALMVHNNNVYGAFDTFYSCTGGGQVCQNRGYGNAVYPIRFFPSLTESGIGILTTEQVLIQDNDFSLSGSLSSVINVRMSLSSGGQSLESLVIRNNVARIASGLTWGGENAYWSVRVDRVASGTSNEIKAAVIEDNKAYGVAGSIPASCYRFDTAQGSAGVVGKITRLRIQNGESNYSGSIVTNSWGSAGDCTRMDFLNETHNNVSNEIFGGTPSNVTVIRVRGISGTYKSEARGTITFNAADTTKTLATGFRSSMFPATLAASDATLTIASAAGSTKTLSLTSIDTVNRTYAVTADAAPGVTMTVNWQVLNQYYYN